MIQGDFYPAKRAKPVGFSGGQFRLVVEPLHHAAGKCNGQLKPDTFLGSLAVIIPFKFKWCFVPQF